MADNKKRKPKPRTRRTTIKIEDDLLEDAKKAAADQGVSLSALIRWLLRQHVERQKNDPFLSLPGLKEETKRKRRTKAEQEEDKE